MASEKAEKVFYAMAPVIHSLWHGSTLCNMPEPPHDWPENHMFVIREPDKVTCPACRQVLDGKREG